MLHRVRHHFFDQGVMEVDVPALSPAASVDAHIDLIESDHGYLHSSPEYGMKKLLAAGSGDIYQLSHVFRAHEFSPLHRPEFMMLEWYRLNFSFQQLIDETCDVIELVIGEQERETLTYREAFQLYVGIDPFTASEEELLTLVDPYEGWELEGRDALLNLILGNQVEPQLGREGLCVLRDYPPSQAALAKRKDGVALRFEIYFKGVELANGYDELANATEQQERFEEANALRVRMGKKELPIDEEFLEALDQLPECCGVAVGFDRLMILSR